METDIEDIEELDEIVGDAVEAFWAEILRRMPHLDIQKLSPVLDRDFTDECRSAVDKFIAANSPAPGGGEIK